MNSITSYPTRTQIHFLKKETQKSLFRKKLRKMGIYTGVGIGIFGLFGGMAYYFTAKE